MKGEHRKVCAGLYPSCLCNDCKRDVSSDKGKTCCDKVAIFCPAIDCPDYEPDDEDECTDDCDHCAYSEHVAWHTWACTRSEDKEDGNA